MPFEFKPFDQMDAGDYRTIGLKVGLEVHQQLLTQRKLFCRCPAGRYSPNYDAVILRHMRPTLSELGEYDGTALMEKKTRKNIYYRIHHDTVCTYEFDDTPPFMIDEEALDIALRIAMLLRLNLVSELHIARKQYLDGSIPTGFQRTGILGVDGWIPYHDRRIRIRQLSIEEDACREVSDIGHDRVYLTDRLGMPLIETVTEPEMQTPDEAAQVGQVLRLLCRSTGQVRTGYGAARQDVNVSVRGGTRVEIKGTPQIWRNKRLIYNEARRQCALLHIRDELRQRGITPDSFHHTTQDVTRTVAQTAYEPIRSAVAMGERVRCVRLLGFADLLNVPTQEHTTFAREFSDRIRVIACLTRRPNLVHSDAPSESVYGREWKELGRKMRARADDTLVLVWGPEADVVTACNEIVLRAREATVGVPSDTRQALRDGTNGFERVLPGAERMYPDTDLPPLAIAQERLDRLAQDLPEFVWDRQARYHRMRLPVDVLEPLCISSRSELFDRLVGQLKIDPTFAAVMLVQRFRAFRRAGLAIERVPDDLVYEVFRAYAEQRLSRAGVRKTLEHLARQARTKAAVELHLPASLPTTERKLLHDGPLTAAIRAELVRLEETRFASPLKKCHYLIGLLMQQYGDRIDGGELARHVRELLHLQPEPQLETQP